LSEPQQEAVAIVGLGAVFPGAGDAPAFWRNIKAGTDAITEVTPDRWDPDLYCDPDRAGGAHFYTRRGGFLGELATFNPRPFGIMPSSVDGTEADQLLMLRAAAAAIEDGGGLTERERVGVIVGRGGYLTAGMTRMDQRVNAGLQLTAVLSDLLPGLEAGRLGEIRAAFEERLGTDDPQDAIGLVPNFSASRLANRFDLRGPAYTVDAACASSLIAVDHAVRELTSGRCDAVLAGGVHICHHPTLWGVFTRLKVLSPGGVIRPFSAGADGTLLSEGAGAVLLMRLDDARAAGKRIYAVIRGVGVSSDGRASSMLNPLVEGQELAIRRAWAAAGLDPAVPGSLGLLEAHGTATPTGDLAELTALGRVFGPAAGGPRAGLGTVKSMIGHAMPAAGIAGLIKTAYAVYEGVLPPTLHVDEPSPALAGTRFAPVTETRPWDDGLVRRAAVSAFGFGGVNAHVVLDAERPARRERIRFSSAPGGAGARAAADAGAHAAPETGLAEAVPAEAVLRLSAGSVAELSRQLSLPDAALLAQAGTEPDPDFGPCRLAVVAPDARRLALARKIVERGAPWRGRSDIWFSPRPLLRSPRQVAFLYPGFEPAFVPRADGVAEAFGLPELQLHADDATGFNGTGADDADEAVLHAVDIVAVGRLFTAALREIGVTPGVLAGHSLGEWTAMVNAGIYPDIDQFLASVQPGLVDLPDVVYLALGTGVTRAAELIGGLGAMVVTHDNCPRQSVVCGPSAQVATTARRAREAGVLAQVMPFRTGFHSPAFAPHVPAVRRAQDALTVCAPRVPVWSATTLAPFPAEPDQIRDLVLRHLVEPVRFRELTERLHDRGIRAFVQVGPGSLTGFTDDTLAGRDYLTVTTSTPKRDGLAQLRRVAAALWTEGLSPRFDRLPAAAPPAPPAVVPSPANPVGPASSTGLAGAGRPVAADALASAQLGPAQPDPAQPDGGAGSVRLRLGSPLVRLAGVVEPLRGGYDGAALAQPGTAPAGLAQAGIEAAGLGAAGLGATVAGMPAGHPALAELNALLSETAAAAESVVAALAQPGPPAAGTLAPSASPVPLVSPVTSASPASPASPVSPGAEPEPEPAGEIRTEREFSLRTMPEIADHCLVPQAEGWHDDSDRFPVVPMTTLLEIMGEAALELSPGQVVAGFQQVRAMRWLNVAPPTRTAVHARWAPNRDAGTTGDLVRVTIEGFASGYVLLADRYPDPPAPDLTPLRDPWAPPVAAPDLYRDRWMFHGPRFAGVGSVTALAADGITGSVLALPTRGALLDSVGQLIGHWMQVVPDRDQNVLPTGIASIRLFGPQPTDGQPLDCTGRIRELTATEMRSDAEICTPDGRVWCQIEGWATRRFATDPVIADARRDPAAHGLSVHAPGGWTVASERWQDTASRELIMRLYLNAAERAEYERVPAPGQRRWLLGRIAVKDAVRRALWERGAGPVFPAELTVAESGTGVRVLGPFRAQPVSLALSPAGTGRPYAAAVAESRSGLTLKAGPDGTVLLAEPGRDRPGQPAAEIRFEAAAAVTIAAASGQLQRPGAPRPGAPRPGEARTGTHPYPTETPEGHR
jgi:acyl transferase domain-containing protein